jgi:hypothetical protein
MITNETKCTWEFKSMISMAKKHTTKRRLFSPENWTEI